ncbi:Retrovirus-related Pol polyprotein from transposon TNT 1-94 [Podosphaera aphanis]|nr:Retrovirus-related Pol polyprotein from transposon TNT 1-94 [Podosphaera aphanis]
MFHHISSTNKSISTASGQLIPVSGVGSVKFRVLIHGEGKASKIIEMENVWYVLTCTRNLVSGVQLLSKGFEIRSLNGGMSVLSSSGEVIATARLREGLLCFNTSPEPTYHFPKGKSDTLFSYNVQTSPTEILHHKFGHVGPRLLENIKISEFKPSNVKAGEVDDFHINEKDLRTCDVCNRCKQVEKINRGPQTKSPTKLELIHSDIWGKCRVPGIFGSLYFVTFTDDCSRETILCLMKSKHDVPYYFRTYKERKELQTGEKIKAMRFDGVTEYKTISFDGISKQICAPYTQHQNGVSERLNRTLITMARCMLSHARLPLRFWDAAVLTACYLRNRLPIHQNRLTPFEVMNGRPPIISHLKEWGCVCYALIDKNDPQRYKLKETSLKDSDLEMDTFDTETIIQPQLLASPTRGTPVGEAREAYSEAEEVPVARDDEVSRENIGQRNTDTLVGIENIPSAEEAANTPNVSGPSETQDIFPPLETPQNPNLRRSSRSRKPIEPRSAWRPRPHALHIGNGRPIPKDFQDAINGPDRAKWQTAINEELDSLRVKKVFTPIIHVPHGRKTVGSRWVFAVKSDGRYKARLVAQGFSQVYGINYFDTYSPTLRMDSLRILLAIGAFYDWEITKLMSRQLISKVTWKRRVDKALYGLKQSGRAWYKKLDAKLSLLNFNQSISDQCIYLHPKLQIVIGVYVDDLVVCGKVLKQVVKTKQQLSSHFPIKDLGEIDVIIGWKITRERSTRTLRTSQAHYITDKVECFSLQDAKAYKSPLDGYDGILPGRENESPADESAYASAVGSLGYASHSTRLDISFTVSQLGKYSSCPVVRHWNSVCRVFRNLKGTADYTITYCFGPLFSEPLQSAKIVMYSDSDYAGDVVTRRSVSGYVVMLDGGPVCWQSKQQKSVSTSTAEAEYVALSEAAKQAVWVNRLLGELHVGDAITNAGGSLILSDNQSALSIAGGTNSAKTKHIDVTCHFVRECIEEKKIQVKYIPTNMMLADLLTKPLSHSKARPSCHELFQLE